MTARPDSHTRLIAGLYALATAFPLSAQSWTPNLAAHPTGEVAYQGTAYPSSSSLRVTWTAPSDVPVDHYLLRAEEKRSSVQARAERDAVDFVWTGLKSGTAYSVRIRACLDPSCDSFIDPSQP